jgi:hypothetical protein
MKIKKAVQLFYFQQILKFIGSDLICIKIKKKTQNFTFITFIMEFITNIIILITKII